MKIRSFSLGSACALTIVLCLTIANAPATTVDGRQFWADARSQALKLNTILFTTGTGQSAQVGTGRTEKVNFTCDAVTIGTNVAATGILQCYMEGQTFGDRYYVANLPRFQPGNAIAVSRTFTGPTQPYLLCKQGAWIDKSGERHDGNASCAFPL